MLGLLASAYTINAQATIYVPNYGTTGLQTFTYTFSHDFFGQLTLGVSDQGDNNASSFLNIIGGTISLDTQNNPVPTNLYLNASNEPGTTGELYTTPFFAFQGAALSFQWEFSTNDYEPHHDFAFIKLKDLNLGEVHYSVLAQVGNVPVPASIWLFGSSLIGYLGLTRRSKQIA